MSEPITPPKPRKPPRLRAPIDVTEKRQPTGEEFTEACAAVDWLGEGFHQGLRLAINEGGGRPGSVPARAVLVAWVLNAFEEGSRAEHTEAASQLVACSDEQLAQLSMVRLPVDRAYQRIWAKTDRVIKALADGFDFQDGSATVHADLAWLFEVFPSAVVPADLPWSHTRSVDGTDWETCGTFVSPDPEYDGATPPDTDTPLEEHAKALAKTRSRLKGKVELGPDGRAIYTRDVDARAGHRSANHQHKAGLYIGYELHLSVQIRDYAYAGKPGQLTYGPHVPNIITSARLVPAGAHRGHATVPMLCAERVPEPGKAPTPDRTGSPVKVVVWDRGYSLLAFENAHGPLLLAGIEPIFELTDAQRSQVQVLTDVTWHDGTPFSKYLPDHLRDLPRIGRNDSAEERRRIQALYDERARWRYSNHGRPDADGYQRLMCPFCAGRLRASQLTQRKVSKNAPLVTLPDGVEKCCGGVITAAPSYFTLAQGLGLVYGTTAWTLAYGPRVLVETANSLLKDKYAALTRTYSKLMGLAKRTFALAFLLAGINRRIIKAWRAKQAEAPAHRKRLRRHQDTLAGLVAAANAPEATGPDTGLTGTSTTHHPTTAPPSRTDPSTPSGKRARKPRASRPLRT
ncbi:hypothetical protein [Cellulomonas sp. P24]|uniref:hypothetical protein n=1 Tax=Cellulomonas sp. P24 TaxID=2885206 RepID=UPI00216ADD14|nr:hypothetical protein [Cellulomonas sp. P24]MCR6492713.1 hypothetical protein [Cellulomonas sp. P24]